jgi:hypothetical protein
MEKEMKADFAKIESRLDNSNNRTVILDSKVVCLHLLATQFLFGLRSNVV